jgi:hypothetical protein
VNDDDELLERLGAALRPEPTELTPPSLQALRRALEQPPAPAPRRWGHRFGVSALAGAAMLAGAGGVAAATGAVLPEPVRAVAHAVGLPVDSPSVAAARAARASLRDGLARHDRTLVAREADRLREALGHLSADERHDLGGVDRMLQQADAQSEGPNPAGGGPTGANQEGQGGTQGRAPGSQGGGGAPNQPAPSPSTPAPGAHDPVNGEHSSPTGPPAASEGELHLPSPTPSSVPPSGVGEQ